LNNNKFNSSTNLNHVNYNNTNESKMICLTSPDEIYYDSSNVNNIDSFQQRNLVTPNSDHHTRYNSNAYSNIKPMNMMKSFGNFVLDDKYMNTTSTHFTTNESNESFADEDFYKQSMYNKNYPQNMSRYNSSVTQGSQGKNFM